MKNRSIAMVITTINPPTPAVRAARESLPDTEFIIVADQKSPSEYQLEGVEYLSVDEQIAMSSRLAQIMPWNHYCRKNLGYLSAIQRGAGIILESDDDNAPTAWGSWEFTQRVNARMISGKKWVNIYKYFTDEAIWPRGLPLEYIREEDSAQTEARESISSRSAPIQQFLASGDPDVDAIYRLIVGKSDHEFRDGSLLLDAGCWVPFNSQCTAWFPEAYSLMYLPVTVSFRMTDIWRSFVAQRILWENDHRLAYHGAAVRQERNVHDLLSDLVQEFDGYRHNDRIADILGQLSLTEMSSEDALLACYDALISAGIISSDERPFVTAWVADVRDLHA